MPNQITRRLTTAVLTATLMLLAGSTLVAAPAVAQTSFTEGTSLSTFPPGAAADAGATFVSTSCGSTGSCYSVGDYGDIPDGEQAVVLPITNGAPGGEVKVPLPPDAATASNQNANLNSVSCWSASSCIAVGYYDNSADNSQAMVVPITNGVVGTGIEVPLPSNTDTDPELEAVSCWSAGSCVAVGDYTNSAGASRTWTVPITNGAVGSGASVSLPGNANTSSSGSTDSELDDVSCAAVGSCVAVGSYFDTRGDREALVVPYSGGVPSAGLEVSEPANAAAVGAQFAQLNDVDCPSAGTCTAIGTYDEPGNDLQPLEAQISGGTPGAGTGIPLPINAARNAFDTSVEGLSCASAGSCVAVGNYETNSGNDEALAVTITNGGGAASAVTLPNDAASSSQDAELKDVGCVASGPCVAAGGYKNTAGDDESMTVSISGASVGSAVTSPAPANESTSSPFAELTTIGCASSGSCAAVGTEENTSGVYQPYVLSVESPPTIGTSSLSAGSLGVAYPSTTLSASGGWGTYSWSISSGGLPAGLSLNAQTGVISGTPTASGSASFTVQVSARGVPTQTATRSLTLDVPAAAMVVKAPDLAVSTSALRDKSNRTEVGLTCADATCTGPVKLEISETVIVKRGKRRVRRVRTVVIGTAKFSIAAGKTREISVTLNVTGQKDLKAARKHRLRVTVTASATGGDSAMRRTTITETFKKSREERMLSARDALTAEAAAQTPFTQGTSLSSLPSGATGADDGFAFDSTSCGSAGSCYAVGYYDDTGVSVSQAVVLPITNGTPGSEVEVSLPAGAAAEGDQTALLDSVSCWSAGSCIAVGTYNDSAGDREGLVVPITNGVVGTGIEVPLPSNTDYGGDLKAISCRSAGSCVAVGDYYWSGASRTWTVPITNAVAGTGASVSLPGNQSTSSTADSELNDVSCASAGSCVAVGDYTDSRGDVEALAVPYNGGAPSAGLEVSEPSNATSVGSQLAQLQYVDCLSAGTCTAIGTYDAAASGNQPLEAQISGGTPGAGTEIQLPGNAVGEGEFAINGLSCASTVSCVAVGDYTTTSAGVGGLAVTINNGAGAASGVTLPGDAGVTRPYGPLFGVSCMPSGPCVAAGDYYNTAGYPEAMTVAVSGASVGSAVTSPAPANESTASPYAELDTIGCAASGSCSAVGIEKNTSGSYQPYVLSLQSPLSIGTYSLSFGALGVPYQSTTPSASGGWDTYSWSISSGTLPAGLSLNAQTGAISGTPTAAGSSSFTLQVSAAGVPTQTATQSLTLDVLAPELGVKGGVLKSKSGRVVLRLVCSDAPCTGIVELELTEIVTVKHGKKRIHKRETVVIGSASCSVGADQTSSVTVKLNGKGRKYLAAAKDHRLSVAVLASPIGGNESIRTSTLTASVKTHRKKR